MADLCSDCLPEGYPTDDTRCANCPRRRIECLGCGQPIRSGEARYTAGETRASPVYWHWTCHEHDRATLIEMEKKLPETIKKLKSTLDEIREHLRHG